MEKIEVSTFKEKKLVHIGEGSKIYELPNNRILKIINQELIEEFSSLGFSYETKILNTKAKKVKEIVGPTAMIYNGQNFCGYTMKKIIGTEINDFLTALNPKDKYSFAFLTNFYAKLEDIIRRANKEGIVVPDMCTKGNIFIQENQEMKLLDFDGIQFGQTDFAPAISSDLGSPMPYFQSSKYSVRPGTFTTEIDKTSLSIFLFLVVFNADLKLLGQYKPEFGRVVTIKDLFGILNIHDQTFMNKIAANMSSNLSGDYLAKDLTRLSHKYDLNIIGFKNGIPIKKLVLKQK